MKSKFALLAVLLLFSPLALAGASNGGGGAAVVCRQTDGQIRYASLLDLYETSQVYGLKLFKPTGSLERDYYLAVANTYSLQGYPEYAEKEKASISENLRKFFEIVSMTPAGQGLPILDDTGEVPMLPSGCAIEQLAIFHDASTLGTDRVEINSEIWRSLDSLNQAALVTHEMNYYWERTLNERTSEATRAVVAHIFADGGVTPVRDGIPSYSMSCLSIDPRFSTVTRYNDGSKSTSYSRISSFDVYPIQTPQGPGMRLQFGSVAGRPTIVKTFIDVSGIQFKLREELNKNRDGYEMIVNEPGKNIDAEIPLSNGLRKGWSINIVYKTDEAVRLVVKNHGVVLTEETLTSCRPN